MILIMNQLVSIITPAYNTEAYISLTIESVINQKYPNWELIIIDDNSMDRTWDIISRVARSEKRIVPIRLNKKTNASIARNEGIKRARGKFIAFIDSDDIWDHDKLKIQINFMNDNNFPLSFTSYKRIDGRGRIISRVYSAPDTVDYRSLLLTNPIGMSTAIYDMGILGKRYLPNIILGHEYGLWLKILKDGYRAKGLDLPLTLYRVHSTSLSRNKFKSLYYIYKLHREIMNFNFVKSYYYLFNNCLRVMLRHIKFRKWNKK